jgi:signal transduction histidine kinase/CheY-like chemotaxis protein
MLPIQSENIAEQLQELRADALQRLAVVIGFVGWVALSWSLWPLQDDRLLRIQVRPIVLTLWVIVLLTYMLRERVTLASSILVLSMLAIIMNVILVFQSVELVYLFSIPIIFASILLRQRVVIVITVSVSILNLVLLPTWLSIPTETLIIPTGVLCLMAFAMMTSAQNLYTALNWALNSVEVAVDNQNIARERQAELAKVLKSLDIAMQNLQRANYALHHAQKRAEEARQLKQQFAQTISHELRTPLNLIIGFTESMIKSPEYYGKPLPPHYIRDLSIVYRNASHLQNLVNDVLDMARIEAAQMTLQCENVDLPLFLQEVTTMTASMVEPRRLELKTDIGDDLPPMVWMDSIRIKQVFYNLVSNAVRFTDSGSITLAASRQYNQIVFAVKDTGIGIAETDIPIVFEPFRQLENPMKRHNGGAGLGLPISRQLVMLHGGTLEVESEVGKGSCFYFTLPFEALTDRTRLQAGQSRPIERKEDNIVLVVTRSASVVSLVERHLEKYRTVVMKDLHEAKTTAQEILPQAIIFDTGDEHLGATDLTDISTTWRLSSTLLIQCPFTSEVTLSQKFSVSGYLIKPVSYERLQTALSAFDHRIKRILLVDDNRDFVRLMERLLDQMGQAYQVTCAYSGQEALARIEYERPDFIFLDLEMPDTSGAKVIESIQANPEWRDIPIVIVSAQDNLDAANRLHGKIEIVRAPHFTQSDAIGWIRHVLS